MVNQLARGLLLATLTACGSSTTNPPGDGGVQSGDAGHDSGLLSGQCRTVDDCNSLGGGFFCGSNLQPPMCKGQCDSNIGPMCKTDGDCADAGVAMICSEPQKPGPCFCFHGGALPQPHCALGCSRNSDCGAGLACDPTHRCVASQCSGPADCGSGNFTCTAQKCAAKPCKSDAECSNFCVMGACSEMIGSCGQAVP